MDPPLPAQRSVHHTLDTSIAIGVRLIPPFVVINLLNLTLSMFFRSSPQLMSPTRVPPVSTSAGRWCRQTPPATARYDYPPGC